MGIEVLKYNKRAQFYLIASVIIVVLIVGLVSITNYSSKKDNSYIKNYGEEFEIESEKVIDYDILNSRNQLENFTRSYSNYIGTRANAYFISGDESNMEAYKYTNNIKTDLTSNLNIADGEINFVVENTTYQFDLNRGENFYFIISKEIEGEMYVYTN